MTRRLLAGLILAIILPAGSWSQAPPRTPPPKLDAVAETKLLMEGLAHPNFKAVDRILKEGPEDAEAWQLARGQSLLIAETANLLMIRPPKSAKGEEAWMARSTELREKATTLAKAVAAKDMSKSRAALGGLAASCNRCHETFRVEERVKVTGPEK